MQPLLDVKNLTVKFCSHNREVTAVQNASFQVNPGEIVGIVGESGSGKTTVAMSILKLCSSSSDLTLGEILFEDENLMLKNEYEMRLFRGKKIGMIFQDPMTSLNPTMPVGKQIMEGMIFHGILSKKLAHQRAIELLQMVDISDPHLRLDQYPYELSGGMRQRVMIAIALSCSPKLIIADEPTTSLDVTVQAQILDILKMIQEKQKTSILLITHDLGVVAKICDRVIVMNSGKILEVGSVEQIFYDPRHPYTQELIACKRTLRKK